MTREEAIETIRRCCPRVGDSQCDFESALRELVPELRESEDERIRKALVKYFEERNNYRDEDETFNGVPFSDIIAYLEKQKELTFISDLPPDDKGEPGEDGILEKQKEQKPAEIAPNQFDGITYGMQGHSTDRPEDRFEEAREKYQVEWSEEDEKMIERLITRLNWITYNTRTDGTSPNITFFDEIAWLKSLRPSWKPSEEQMEALEYVIRDYREDSCNATANYLQEILDHLKNM